MTAPALILLAPAPAAPREMTILQGIRKDLQTKRPEFNVQLALSGPGKGSPSLHHVVSRLARARVDEAVVTPLELSSAFTESQPLRHQVDQLGAEHASIRLGLARPIGPEASLLAVVDRQLRLALSRQHAAEVDGLVLSVGDSGDARSASLVQRRARQWGMHHKLPVVTAVTVQGSTDMAEAIRSLRSQGRRHIGIGSWFLTACQDYALQSGVAHRLGALAVAEPFGNQPEIGDLVLERYVVACMDLIDFGGDEAAIESHHPANRHLSIVASA